MITFRVTDRPNKDLGADPKVVLTIEGTHDVGRLVHLLAGGLVEHVATAGEMVHKLRALSGGLAALALLAEHGGPDYTTEYPGGFAPDEAGE